MLQKDDILADLFLLFTGKEQNLDGKENTFSGKEQISLVKSKHRWERANFQ